MIKIILYDYDYDYDYDALQFYKIDPSVFMLDKFLAKSIPND